MGKSKAAPSMLAALALVGCIGEVAGPETIDSTKNDHPGVQNHQVDVQSAELEEAPSLDELWDMRPEPLSATVPSEVVDELAQYGEQKRIVGRDGRVQVSNTQIQPYSTIARLYPLFPTEARPGLCTGSFIGPDAVLTAAHCVYDADAGGWAKSIRVVPAEMPDAHGRPTAPLGTTSAKRLFASVEYRTGTDFWTQEPYDYAVIRVKDPLGKKVGVRKFGVLEEASLGRFVQLAAYHSDLCARPPCSPATSAYRLYSSSDQLREFLTDSLFNHYADSFPGSSGGPLVTDGAFFNTIFAVHVAGLGVPNNTWNMGVLITPEIHANIREWSGRKL